MIDRIRALVRALFARNQFESDMSHELRFHIETYTADLVRAGVPPGEARRRAGIEFGSVDNVKRDCRQARGLHVFDVIVEDVRYALRLMRKTPAFTATALATVAICLGANLAVFAVVDSVLLRPLPFPESERLVKRVQQLPEGGRSERRRIADQLLRAARPHTRLLGARGPSRRRCHRRRGRSHGSRGDRARLPRVLLDRWACPSAAGRSQRPRRRSRPTTSRS